MKKSILTIFAIIFAAITFGQVLGDFPVSPNQGGITEATHRQRVIDGSGSYLSNIAPHQLDLLTSYGIVPDNLMIPSGRKASVLYSQFPTDGTGDFVVVNAAVKNEINSNGLFEEIAANIAGFNYTFGFPVLEVNEATENLIEYPVSVTNDYWVKSGVQIDGNPASQGSEEVTNGTFTGSAAGWDLVGTSTYGANAVTITADGTSNNTLGQINLWANNARDAEYLVLEYEVTANSLVGTGDVRIGSWLGDEIFADQLIDVTVGVHTITKKPDRGGNQDAIYFRVINGNSSGIITFDNVSIKIVTGFPSPSVDLPVSGFKLTEDDQNSTHYFTKASITVTNGVTLTQSIKAKQGERNWIRFEEIESGDGYYFDLENGVVGTEIGTVVNSSITAMSGGYWDISITVTVPSTDAEFRVGLADADNSNSYAGDGSSGLFVAFAQLEELPYASTWTFISEGSTSSRIADQINNATYIESGEGGTLYAEIAAFADDGNDRYISISDGSVVNAIQLYYSSTTNQIVGKIIVGSATQATLTYTLSDESEFAKCLVSWATDDFTLVVNGVERATDVSGSVPAFGVLDEISLDDGAGDNDFYGYIKELATLGITTTTERVNITTQ